MEKNHQEIKEYLKHLVKNLPVNPGVYKMKDSEGKIIYIGKAKNLKNRVSTYFNNSLDKSPRTLKMVSQVADFDYTVVDSDLEALMLETNLIKEVRPKYNILMKDDKNYVYIRVTTQETYPRITVVRKVFKDKARYFGPKTSRADVIKTLKVLKKIFPYRHCQLDIEDLGPEPMEEGQSQQKRKVKVTHAGIKYPCLDYFIKRCTAPCIGNTSPEDYQGLVDQILRFLEGKHDDIVSQLENEMRQAAAEKKFERAANIRNRVTAIRDMSESQRVSDSRQEDVDVVNYVIQDGKIYFNLFQLRLGKLIQQENFVFQFQGGEKQIAPTESYKDEQEILGAFLKQYYETATDFPREVFLPHEVDEPEIIENWLQELSTRKVKLVTPLYGKKDKLLDLSYENAQSFAKQSEIKWQGQMKNDRVLVLEELQKLLNLPTLPKRLECYDISHISGTETVASMVVFENGFPKKEDYRKFKLSQETAGSPDDFASMYEALSRRLKYLKPGVARQEVKLIKPKKKELEEILIRTFGKELVLAKQQAVTGKNTERKEVTETKVSLFPEFFHISHGEHIVGTVGVEWKEKKLLIAHLELTEKVDMALLWKKVMEKLKTARCYFIAKEDEVPGYEEQGAQQVRKIPDTISLAKNETLMCFDKGKYKVDKSFQSRPDLIIIDGGKGQLSSALKARDRYELDVPMVSLAKREEEIFTPGNSAPILLEKSDPMIHLFQHIRDEAHRFAITYNRNLRANSMTQSVLDEIEGIGEASKMKLLKNYGSIDGLKAATMNEIAQLVGKKNAMRIKEKLG